MIGVPSILVIDDDPTTRAMLQGMLQKEGYRTTGASDGPTGRSVAQAHRPDLILLDVNMPGESGFETCQSLKADANTSLIPILFLSAQDDLASKVQGLEAGGVDYITKPFQRAEVLARVRTHLRLARMVQEWLEYQTCRLRQLTEAQQAILPRPQEFPEARFAVCYRPLHEAGGDFYDVIPAGDGIVDYVVADVSGHNLGTSLTTAALKVLLRQHASPLYSPAESLQMINRAIPGTLQETQYLTLIYARLNRRSWTLSCCSAGHPAPILMRRNEPAQILDLTGDVLGVFPNASFDTLEIKVGQGDRLFLFSDGVLESDCPRLASVSGSARLIPLLESTREASTLEACLGSLCSCLHHSGPAKDDFCLLGAEV